MQTIDTIFGAGNAREASGSRLKAGRVLPRVTNWLWGRTQIRRSRAALLELSDSQLRDIGLTREQAALEGGLPWWR